MTPTILLVEDDQDYCFLVKQIREELQLPGGVMTMTNGDDLIGYLQCSPLPDMILLDINLPGKDGLTLLKEIRQNDLWRDVPVVMFSVAHDPYTIKQAYELGANFYLHKPALYSTFRNALRTVFGLTRAQLLNKRSLSDYLLS